MLIKAVRLNCPKGARLKDPQPLVKARLDSKTVRAIDFHEGDPIDAAELKALVRPGATLNRRKG
jgi:hypothetical protein